MWLLRKICGLIFSSSNFLLSPRREDAKKTHEMGSMMEDKIARQIHRAVGSGLHFGEARMKHGITRTVNWLPEESC